MALLALCGEKRDLSVKEVRLSESAHAAVAEVFAAQEAAFRDGDERPFDQNWKSEGNEISTTPIPASEKVFERINAATDTTLPPTLDIEEVRGLAMKLGRGERILVQSFVPAQTLGRSWLSLISDEKGTFDRLDSPTFRLADKLVCIIEDGSIKFRSLYNLGRVIDTSAIFRDATDQEIKDFATTYSNVFEIDDVNAFVGRSNRNARKYIASLEKSGALQAHTAASLQAGAQETNLTITVREGKIIMPARAEISRSYCNTSTTVALSVQSRKGRSSPTRGDQPISRAELFRAGRSP